MTTRRKRDSISSVLKPLTRIFKVSKPRPSASQNEGQISSELSNREPAFSTEAKYPPDPNPHKRKASTSAPSSPFSIRPKQKRVAPAPDSPETSISKPASTGLGLLSPPPNSFAPPSTEPELVSKHPSLFSQTFEEDSSFSLGSASDRSVSVSSQSINSLASHRHNAWALKARARDAVDARRVLKTITQVKENTYRAKKGGPGGKYLIERTLHYRGYKLLEEILSRSENDELSRWVNTRLRYAYWSHYKIWRLTMH